MLNEEQVQKVKLMISGSGWNDVLRPVIAKRAQDAIRSLVIPPEQRSGEHKGLSDDALRAKLQEAEWMLVAWDQEVKVFEHNRRLEELERQQDGANPQNLAANP